MFDKEKEQACLKSIVRLPTIEDKKKLPVYSHSRLECFENCSYQYYLKYEQKKYSADTTIALELGTLCHYIYEIAAKMWLDNKGIIDYDYLWDILENGHIENKVTGLNTLRKKYFEEWYTADSEGHFYDWKIEQFKKGIQQYFSNMISWKPYKQEMFFEFVFNNRAIILGYIDAILINDQGELMCQDFKTSKKQFPQSKIPTSQQFGIYCMGMLAKLGQIPIQCDYKFVLLNETQNALTDGFGNRIIKKLNGVLDKIDKNKKTEIWTPTPSPLCMWCNFSITNPKAHEFKNDCEYYSLWTPENRVWAVNKKYNALDNASKKSTIDTGNKTKLNGKRKLIF